MRLLYVIDSLAPGGAETSLADMAPGLAARGIELHVLSLGHRLDLAGRLSDSGAVVHSPDAVGGRLRSVMAVRDLARRVRPDLIHTTLYEADVAGRLAARTLGLRASTSLVTDSYSPSHYLEHNTIRLHAARSLDAATARSAVRFHAITNAIADSVSPRLGIPRSKIDVIPRGRDAGAFPLRTPESRGISRASLAIDTDARVILNIARREPPKGQMLLLRALSRLPYLPDELVVLIAGKDGKASVPLREYAAMLPIDVRFLGHRTDLVALLSAADIFCFPSEREGLGGVLIEALAVGCPIVATDIPTSREVMSDREGIVGVLTMREPDSLARGIAELLDSEERRCSLTTRGRRLFEDRFTGDRVASDMAAFFERARHE